VKLIRDIFREYDIRGITGTQLTPEVARLVGRAFAAFLGEGGVRGSVAVGRDNRPSGDALHDELVAGLRESGIDVVDIGVAPTPVAYWAQHNLDVVAGVQITGSHNPPEYNGFKLGVGKASIYGDDIQKIYQLAAAGVFPVGSGSLRSEPVIDRYIDDVVSRIGRVSRPLRIVADAGNGAGSLVAPALFAKLGVDVTCLFCESDGTFPNHHADPTVPENLEDVMREVRKGGYDLGIAFDGDADRIGVIEPSGDIIWGDYLLILYARDVLARVAEAPIIFDVKCSQALPEAIEKAGGVPVMWKTGHSLIEEKMHDMHSPLAGEMSGHMYFGEGWYGFDDALYGAARLLRIVADSGKSLTELLADVPRFVSTPEIRVDCPDDRKFGIVREAVKHFGEMYSTNDVDGVRVQYPDGWGLIRASNTQPVIVLRFEARTQPQLDRIRAEIEGWLTQHGVRI
jgi:phosphomannomutase/phosphoglucomutase